MLRVACFVLLVCRLLILVTTPLHAQEPHQAGLVVQFGDGTIVTRCVTFTEDEISGEDVLQHSGLTVLFDYTSGLGTRVCKIEGDGCEIPTENCWCQCQGSPCLYWNYFHVADGAWRYAGLGCSNRTVRDGDVEGWVWGDGHTPPLLISPDDICGTSAAASSSPTSPEPSTTTTPSASPPVAQPSPTLPATRSPLSGKSTSTTATPPTNLGGYAAFAAIAIVLSGLGLFLRRRVT
jgi:hypothetical protein